MSEKLETIPVNDAFDSGDECPFCYLRRKAEQSTLRYVAGPGASYMEPDVRAATDELGFCREHLQALYDYGNTLGSALMLQTYYARVLNELQTELDRFEPPAKRTLFGRKKAEDAAEPYWKRLERKNGGCFLCNRIDYHMDRYYSTFFYLLKDAAFQEKLAHSKGFCLPHFAELLKRAETDLPNGQRDWFYPTLFRVTGENLNRVKEDLDWLIAKFDYRNAGADWKNSQDALPRAMEKLRGGHPADEPFRQK